MPIHQIRWHIGQPRLEGRVKIIASSLSEFSGGLRWVLTSCYLILTFRIIFEIQWIPIICFNLALVDMAWELVVILIPSKVIIPRVPGWVVEWFEIWLLLLLCLLVFTLCCFSPHFRLLLFFFGLLFGWFFLFGSFFRALRVVFYFIFTFFLYNFGCWSSSFLAALKPVIILFFGLFHWDLKGL